jgi:hypothetical protein
MALIMGAEYKREMRRLLTALCALFALASPLLGFEQEIPATELRFSEAAGSQRHPALASDGRVFWFAVWEDEREGEPLAVYGTRVRIADARVMEPRGVRLLEGGGRPSIAFGADRYLVVDSSLQFAIVDPGANVLVRGRIANESGGMTRVVFNGRDFVVFYGVGVVRAATVDVAGRVAGQPVTVVQGSEIQLHDAAASADRIVILYTSGVDLHAAVTTSTGAPIGTALLSTDVWAAPGGTAQAAVASAGGGFMAVWRRFTAGDVMAQRLSAEGAPLASAVQAVAAASQVDLIAATESYWLYTAEVDGLQRAFVARRNVRASDAIAGSPVVELTPGFVAMNALGTIAAAPAANSMGVVGEAFDDRGSNGSAMIFGTGYGQRTLSEAGKAQQRPAIASGSDGTLVVWRAREGTRTGGSMLRGIPFGDVNDPLPQGDAPSIAVQGRTYLVTGGTFGAWAQVVRRGGPVGNVLELDASGRFPVAAASGGEFIVAWINTGAGEVRLARVSTAGELLATNAIPLRTLTGVPMPGLACDDGECLIAWHEETSYATCPRFACIVVETRVRAVRFDDELAIRDAEPLTLTPEPTERARISVAADDGRYAVAWQERFDVRAVTLDASGAVELSTRMAGLTPAVARHGDAWLLVREVDDRLVARWLGRGVERILTPADGQARRAPSLFALGERVLAVYERTTRNEEAGGVPRAYVLEIAPPPSPRRRPASFR